jgi:hypothetical protein
MADVIQASGVQLRGCSDFARRPVGRRGWVRLLAALLAALTVSAGAQLDGDNTALERRIKAAFIYKFAGYVEWPNGTFPNPDSPIVIAVAGDEQLASELSRLTAGHTVDGRNLEIRRQVDSELAVGVNILFVASGEMARLRNKATRPVLIITEAEGALSQGSTINFYMEGGKVRFELSNASAEQRHLKLSSRLITVAQNMRSGAN